MRGWKDVGMVATRYCKGIAVLIVACFVGFRGSVELFGVVHPYINDLCIFCECAFFLLLVWVVFWGGVRAGECMGMDGGICVCMWML